MVEMKKMMAKRLIFGMLLCGALFLALPAEEIVPFTDITPAQAAALIKEKGTDPLFVILDTRTAQEFALNHIKGAMNIDVKLHDFMDKVAKLDKNGTYLAYCLGSMRSAKAMNLMKEWGFKEVYNLGGGLMKWQAEKLPLEGAPLPAEPTASR
jgi:rhodanese-related sulfurtransferase